MNASDIMTKGVITVGPDTPVSEVVSTLLDNRISAVPVVEGDVIVGILSEGDLLRRHEIGTERHRPRWLEFGTSETKLAAEYVKEHGRRAGDVMTKNVVTVTADTPIAEIADILESRHIKRVPVTSDGKLVGIVSRANLIQALASGPARTLEAGSADDRAIREALFNELRQHKWATTPLENNVIVADHEVHYWGVIHSEEQREAMLVAARNIPGVRRVADHMDYPPAVPIA